MLLASCIFVGMDALIYPISLVSISPFAKPLEPHVACASSPVIAGAFISPAAPSGYLLRHLMPGMIGNSEEALNK